MYLKATALRNHSTAVLTLNPESKKNNTHVTSMSISWSCIRFELIPKWKLRNV